jgi:hypothetical protein
MIIIKKIWSKVESISIYFVISVAVAIIEVIIGWRLILIVPDKIILTNTITVIVSAVLHYFLTLTIVFKKKNTYKSLLVYIGTFFVGIILQDSVIWLFYTVLLTMLSDFWQYLVSKAFSLGIPFFAIYYMRSYLYKKIK